MSNPFSDRRIQRSQLLNVAEYTSIAASVAGVVVSALSQQVLYAAAPLSLSLCLSVVNRRRFEQQTEQRFNGAITQIDQRVTDLSTQLTDFQHSQHETAIDLSELRSQLSQLQERFTTIVQGQNATADNLGDLEARLSRLNGQLTAIQQRQKQTETHQTALDAQISQIGESLSQDIQDIHQQLQAAVPSLDGLEALQQEFSQIVEQISRLQEQVRRIEPRLPPPPPLEDLLLNLGIDFGTSFTKVCFRDIARDRSEIVTFMDEITHLEEALLPTKIGILSDGRLIAGLTASEWKDYEIQVQTTVEFIKMRLADLDLPQCNESWRLEEIPHLDNPETVENLCAYYLSRVIIRTQTWVRQTKPELVFNQKIEWSANVGVPVEYCDSSALERFKKVLSLAWILSNEPQTEWVTIQGLGDLMNPLRERLEEQSIDCHAVPEIAAEVASLINSLEVDEGFYVLFDIGDGTLDGSSFRYWNDDGEKKVDFYFGKVAPLGVTAASQRLAQELGVTESDIKTNIRGSLTHYSSRLQASKARKAIQELVGLVVVRGSQRHGEHGFRLMRRGSERPLEILIGGGGGQTTFYTQAITSTYHDFKHKNAGIPEYAVRSLPMPKDLETNGIRSNDFHRFAVAYGLSIPKGEQPEIRLPSEMEKVKPTPPQGPDPMGKKPPGNEPR